MVLFLFPSCFNVSSLNKPLLKHYDKEETLVTSKDSVFSFLEKKWISSTYFDQGLNYESSLLEVVSLPDLLKFYSLEGRADAILLNCADDYQGIISINDVKKYDLQIALKIELLQGSVRPDWLQPMLIVVPNHTKPPFSERFLTANITELRFITLAEYYAPLNSLVRGNANAQFGLGVFKDNCLFCHSINKVGGNKGTSLFNLFDLTLGSEKQIFKEKFLDKHGRDNDTKQNMGQFIDNNQFEALLEFLYKVAVNN
jgi:cytochrome c2